MSAITTALAPIFILILMGYVLRRRELLAQEFWLPCEKLNYFYLFPALMFSQIAKADFGGISLEAIAAALLGAVAVGGLAVFLWRAASPQTGPVFSTVLQGALRPNTYVGVAAASAIYGKPGLTITAVAIALTIPLLNVGSILVLSRYGEEDPATERRFIMTVLTNPVILSVLAGGIVNRIGLAIPAAAEHVLTILGGASLPLGLLAVGAGLDLGAAYSARGPVLRSSLIKLALVPFATYVIGAASGLNGALLGTVVLFNALPCTPSVYIMARLMGGDHRIAAGIISVQTVLASISMPIVMLALAR